jgi:hypothetical protein
VRGLELLSEAFFCHLKSIMFPNNDTASEDNEKIRELACYVVYSNIAIGSLPTLQISLVIVRFMMVSLFLPSSQISGSMCKQLHVLLANNRNRVSRGVLRLSQNGACVNCLKMIVSDFQNFTIKSLWYVH